MPSPAQTITSAFFACASVSRIHSAVWRVAMAASARATCLNSSPRCSVPGADRNSAAMSPASATNGTRNASAYACPDRSPSSSTSWPASSIARQHAASGRVSPSVPNVSAMMRSGLPWARHRGRVDPAVEVLAADKTELQRRLPQRRLVAMRGEGDLRGVLVPDVGIERGHEHQRALEVCADAIDGRLDSLRAALVERIDRIGEKLDRFECALQHHRLVDIELEVALAARE